MNKDLSTTTKQRIYADTISKENRLRMKWFKRNEQRLVEYAEKEPPKKVTDGEKDKLIADRQERYRNAEKKTRKSSEDEKIPLIDSNAVYHLMKPVDAEVRRLLYTGTEKNGRKNYLHERVKIIPENKYYFQETVNFIYGWKMWNHCKENPTKRYGRCRIIQDSFYRKNNVGRDPDWYREPAKLSPTTCGC